MPPLPDAVTELIPIVTEPPPRRRRRFARWLIAGLVVVALAVGAVVLVSRHRAATAPQPEQTVAASTAQLERKDLSTTMSLPGTLGYGTPRPLAGHKEATVTWLPQIGATIKRGKQLFRADDRPVTLFYGSMPLYRDITGTNLVGRDVKIIATNLSALGYSIGHQPSEGSWVSVPQPAAATPPSTPPTPPPTKPVEVKDGEGVLTAALKNAIKSWQDDAGLPRTGTITVGDVEVLSGAVRVDAVAVQPGSPANADLMSVTPTRKVITVDAQLTEAGSIKQGAKVTVVLPDEKTVKARVTAVGRKLAAEGDAGTGPPTLTVTVTADQPKDLDKLDAADVNVTFPGRSAKGVLAAPVEALVALTEGGYAVQGPAGLIAVQTGMFADGWVELTGDGLTEGMAVVVSS
ncbi:efflux RND transporter periplasmic adaptor subunit [Winogradskya humida]|uniref:Peptidoglycan-binding protein n=1 Tax=Winogradskya humida TaxID=113566 RepID=A0ABQ4A2N2_9ACTN|nr:efflux RND transporter periplasmic adaptor subunit [Actinoplanes humidus]GIE25110.1 peptidoglycan-binding protein [Actinoplanes humidus]